MLTWEMVQYISEFLGESLTQEEAKKRWNDMNIFCKALTREYYYKLKEDE